MTYTVLALCILVSILIRSISDGSLIEAGIICGAYYRPFIVAGEVHRLLTAGLVHTDPMHLLVNMFSLINAGTITEKIFGHQRFAGLLACSVLCGSIAIFVFTDTAAAVGLSGGLYGLMGAYFWLMIQLGAMRDMNFRNGLIRIAAVNLAISLIPGVSLAAHAGGLIGGLLTAMVLFRKRMEPKQRNMVLAGCALALLISIGGMVMKWKIPEGQRYPGTDYHVLCFYRDHGLQGHAYAMADRLDIIYEDGSMLAYMLREE